MNALQISRTAIFPNRNDTQVLFLLTAYDFVRNGSIVK